jgi:hypothetical protein
MRRWLMAACIAAMVCGAWQVSAAERRPIHTQLYRTWIQGRTHFTLAGGHIINANNGFGWGMGSQSVSDGEVHEKIVFNSNNGMTGSVEYSYNRAKTDAENHKQEVLDMAVQFSTEGRFLLRYKDIEDPQSYFELSQVTGQPVQLSLPPAGKPRVLQAPTVWHLLVIYAEDCRKGLVPGLEMVRPDWRVDGMVAAAESELVKLAASAQKLDRQQWAAWVDQLGDPLCTRRERADRKLRDAGPAILSYLNRLNMGRLDAEQQFRIRRIVHVLSTQQGEDSPEAVAALLVGDPYVWLALLSRDDEAMRRAAAQQLEQILNAPVKVDPKAAPASQAKAREELRKQLEKLAADGGRHEK